MTAKALRVEPIDGKVAATFVRRNHYSAKTAANSQLHLGVFWEGKLEGALQFGPSIDKRKTMNLVKDTHWNGFLELNRMAFSERLPRNSESRALSVAMKLIRKNYKHIEWVVSFADGSQCGDGTIYRASGFVLTQIKENRTMIRFPDGHVYASISITNESGNGQSTKKQLCAKWGVPYFSASSVQPFIEAGAEYIPGFQLRYVYFLNPAARDRLTVPILPFSAIDDAGARMYRGVRASEA